MRGVRKKEKKMRIEIDRWAQAVIDEYYNGSIAEFLAETKAETT